MVDRRRLVELAGDVVDLEADLLRACQTNRSSSYGRLVGLEGSVVIHWADLARGLDALVTALWPTWRITTLLVEVGSTTRLELLQSSTLYRGLDLRVLGARLLRAYVRQVPRRAFLQRLELDVLDFRTQHHWKFQSFHL